MGLDIDTTYWAVFVGAEPLVHALHVEQVHTWQSPAVGIDFEDRETDGALLVLVVRRGPCVRVSVRVAVDDGPRCAARRPPRAPPRLRRAHHGRRERAAALYHRLY